MMILITGGSKCGKSRYAESLFDKVSGKKYYMATMVPFGDEAWQAIDRHREMRAEKGFKTIERYTDAGAVSIEPGSAVLLECLGNLTANEMFREGNVPLDCKNKIFCDIIELKDKTSLLVIVTNDVGSDSLFYESGTQKYIEVLGKLNTEIAEAADKVVECVYGIPVVLKDVNSFSDLSNDADDTKIYQSECDHRKEECGC